MWSMRDKVIIMSSWHSAGTILKYVLPTKTNLTIPHVISQLSQFEVDVDPNTAIAYLHLNFISRCSDKLVELNESHLSHLETHVGEDIECMLTRAYSTTPCPVLIAQSLSAPFLLPSCRDTNPGMRCICPASSYCHRGLSLRSMCLHRKGLVVHP